MQAAFYVCNSRKAHSFSSQKLTSFYLQHNSINASPLYAMLVTESFARVKHFVFFNMNSMAVRAFLNFHD